MFALNNATISALSAISSTEEWSTKVAIPTVKDWTVTTIFTTIDLSDRTINALESHWTNHGDTYKYWASVAAKTVLAAIGLVLMFLKAQMGHDGAYEELVEVVEALDQVAKKIVVTACITFKAIVMDIISELVTNWLEWFEDSLYYGANYWVYRKVR